MLLKSKKCLNVCLSLCLMFLSQFLTYFLKNSDSTATIKHIKDVFHIAKVAQMETLVYQRNQLCVWPCACDQIVQPPFGECMNACMHHHLIYTHSHLTQSLHAYLHNTCIHAHMITCALIVALIVFWSRIPPVQSHQRLAQRKWTM